MPATKGNTAINRKMYDFMGILRDASISISTDEVLSLFNALDHTSVGNRRVFKQTLQTTLIKDFTDIPAFEKCFDAFFGYGGSSAGGGDEAAVLDSMNRFGESGAANREEMENIGEAMDSFLDGLEENQLFEKNSQEILSLFLQEMENEGSSGGMGMMLFQTKRSSIRSGRGRDEAEPDEAGEELSRMLLAMIGQRISRARIGKEIRKREDYLLGKYIYQLKPDEIKEMREIIKRFGQKLKNRISLRKKRVKHGGIDIKKTLRSSLEYGGIPFRIFHKDRKIDRPQLVVLCDVSGSVNQYSRFMLLLTHTLQSLFSKVRTFAFIGNMIEITGLFMEMDPERAINSIFSDTDFTYGWGSNYGRSFDQFMGEYSDSLNKKTTILVLGDARNNNQDPGLGSFIRMKERSRNIYWLNPEKRHLWDWSDSIATLYLKHCTDMKEVNNFLDLSEFIDKLFIR